MEFSLMFPPNADQTYHTLTAEAVNDLSIDFIVEALTEVKNEREHIRTLMTHVTDDPAVIQYRRDVFEDFMRFPQLREKMEELVKRLIDLKDLERFQKDQDGPSLWSLVNRLREIDEYVRCISMLKDILDSLDIQSEGMKTLRRLVTTISRESGFPELKADIDETMEKARKLKSVTIGVNLDSMLRPMSAGVISLNDAYFSDAGLMRRFMKFAGKEGELHHGTDVSNLKSFHPKNPVSLNIGVGSFQQSAVSTDVQFETETLTGTDALSNAIKKPVSNIMKKTCDDIKSTLRRYVNISGYMLTGLMPEIIFFVRWATPD